MKLKQEFEVGLAVGIRDPEFMKRFSVDRIGDCEAPGIIAMAVHSGHRFARELDSAEHRYLHYLPEMNQRGV